MIDLSDANTTWPRYTVGLYRLGGKAMTLHASPPDQESINVVLLEGLISGEQGQLITVPRRDFIATHTQEDL